MDEDRSMTDLELIYVGDVLPHPGRSPTGHLLVDRNRTTSARLSFVLGYLFPTEGEGQYRHTTNTMVA
jgi:hypothetical protein